MKEESVCIFIFLLHDFHGSILIRNNGNLHQPPFYEKIAASLTRLRPVQVHVIGMNLKRVVNAYCMFMILQHYQGIVL